MKKTYIASVSGGKDSTAMCLYLKERGIVYRAVHFDTGWETETTMRYVREVLPAHIGPIEIRTRLPELAPELEAYALELEGMLGFHSPFVRWVLKKQMFPARVIRYCTQELKVFVVRDVVREIHAANELPVNVVGIRAAESRARAQLPEHEISTSLDCAIWRPILNWTERDVIEIHKRHGVPPNPMYLRGASRVGCYPCIFARKIEVRALTEKRIAVIERLEAIIGQLRLERAAIAGESVTDTPTFFQRRRRQENEPPTVAIREHVRWSQTARGSDEQDQQLAFGQFNDGCLRWGLCDLGASDG